MQNPSGAAPLRVAYFFTRFPHPTETFLQREVRAMRRLGVALELYSWHRGAAEFEGLRIRRFSKWRLLTLFWRAASEWWQRPVEIVELARRLFLTGPRDWLNQWENLYGAGIGAVVARHFRRAPVDHIHAVWASLPAMVAWTVSRLTDIPFSLGAHAYDVFEHDGDWFLREKCSAAAFVHTSTRAAQRRLVAMGVDPDRILLAYRGLDRLPPPRTPRARRTPLRIACIARLVEKKGLRRQIAIYRACRAADLQFQVRLIGDGPLREELRAAIRGAQLENHVSLAGAIAPDAVWAELAAADVLVHTGVVASSGDRDGLPNVVAEAMAAGAVVVTAPGAGVQEAVEDGVTGLVCPLDDAGAWVRAFRRLQADDVLMQRLQQAARSWVERNFVATTNAAAILERFRASRRSLS